MSEKIIKKVNIKYSKLKNSKLILNILNSAGISEDDKVLILVKPSSVHITKNPVESLWGSLKSKKDALELKMETYEEIGEILDDKLS